MLDDVYRPKVKVKRATAGLGLFTMEDIKKNQLIIEYTGDRITQKEADKRGGKYLFEVTDNLVIDGSSRQNLARYLNHSCKPNAEAEHDEEDDRIYIRAIKKIHTGEEITFHYGKTYVKEIIKPQGCKCQTCAQ